MQTVGSGTTTVSLGGVVLGAGLVAAVGPGWGLAADAGSFLLTAALFSRLRLAERPSSGGTMLDELREGWNAFVIHSWIWTTVLAFLFINAVYSGAVGQVAIGPISNADGRTTTLVSAAALTVAACTTTFLLPSIRRLDPPQLGQAPTADGAMATKTVDHN